MGLLGIFAALALLIGLSYRGWSVLLLAPAAALVVAASWDGMRARLFKRPAPPAV